MDLKNYFTTQIGLGILSSADRLGKVNAAIYARPHVMDDGTIALIMRDRLSRKNLLENPCAAYMFIEAGPGYKGVRLLLKKVKEDSDPERVKILSRRCLSEEEDQAKGPKFIVYFEVEKTLKLIGGDAA